jgi:hypothetical protein
MIPPGEIVIATMTLARTPAEEKLLQSALTRLVSLGFPVVAVDGGSSAEFVSFLKEVRIKLATTKKRGLVPQVEASLATASKMGPSYILYTEPDKDLFFGGPILDFLRAVKPSKKLGVALAARDAKGFQTFPAAQRNSETFINNVAGELFGVEGDYCYGPLLFPATLAAEVKNLRVELGWGWRFHLMRRAHELGLRIIHVPLPVVCPKDQRAETPKDRIYRYRQLRQNLEGTVG